MNEQDDEWDMQSPMTRFVGPADFHGAALIDAEGHEIAITEDMVRNACDCLEEAWRFPCGCEDLLVLAPGDFPAQPDSPQPET